MRPTGFVLGHVSPTGVTIVHVSPTGNDGACGDMIEQGVNLLVYQPVIAVAYM